MRDLFFLFGWGSVGWGDLIRSISSFQWPCRSFGLVSLRSLPWHLCRRSLVLVFPSVWSFRVGLVVPLFLSCCWSRPPVGFVVPLALSFLLTFSFRPPCRFLSYRHPVGLVVLSVSSFRRSRRPVVLVVPMTFSFRPPRRSFRIVIPSASSFSRSRQSVGFVVPSVSSFRCPCRSY